MRELLPTTLIETITSDKFVADADARFDKLDVNKNDALENTELAPVIVDMMATLRSFVYASLRKSGTGLGEVNQESERLAPPMSHDQCMGFVGLIFDENKDGSIQRGEWHRMIQFVACSHYLEANKEVAKPKPKPPKGYIHQQDQPPPAPGDRSLEGKPHPNTKVSAARRDSGRVPRSGRRGGCPGRLRRPLRPPSLRPPPSFPHELPSHHLTLLPR